MPLSAPGKFKTDAQGNAYGGEGVGEDFLTTALDNTLAGKNAGGEVTSGDDNTIVGADNLSSITTQSFNTSVGSFIAPICLAVSSSVLLGYNIYPLVTNTITGSICIGNGIGVNTVAGSSQLTNIIIGNDACPGAATNFNNNVMIGQLIGSSVTTALQNVVIGDRAGNAGLTVGVGSVIIGALAALNTGGTTNIEGAVIVGYSAGQRSTGQNVVVIGPSAGFQANGQDSIYIGLSAGGANISHVGIRVIGIGNSALANCTGNYNIALGSSAGTAVTSGVDNLLLGKNAASTLNTGSRNVVIGPDVPVSAVGVSDELRIGVGTTPLLDGSHTANARRLLINGAVELRHLPSNANITTTDQTIVGCTVAGITITIKSTTILKSGAIFIIKDESGGALASPITIATEGTELIDGAATIQILVNYGSVRLYSNGSNLFTF